jgi:S-adenosylmethionine hydrolase
MVPQDSLGPPIVTLLTDFGLGDAYVGVIKGVILSRAPHARLVDLTHEVPPQAIESAAFLLEGAWRYFPAGTVHLVVVDPGVGTQRRRIALRSDGHLFVGPDNGVLSAALPDRTRGTRASGEAYVAKEVPLPAGVEAVLIESETLLSHSLSATFEGRDAFAPAAGHLAAGAPLSDLGPPADRILALPAFRAPRRPDGSLDGLVVHVDHYGNLITDVRAADLPPNPLFEVAGRVVPLARTYAEGQGLCAIVSSAGSVEIALPNDSAAAALGIGRGAHVSALDSGR